MEQCSCFAPFIENNNAFSTPLSPCPVTELPISPIDLLLPDGQNFILQHEVRIRAVHTSSKEHRNCRHEHDPKDTDCPRVGGCGKLRSMRHNMKNSNSDIEKRDLNQLGD